MIKTLSGKVALITGAGTGIGRATALLLARKGTKIIVNYSKSRSEAEQTVADIARIDSESFAVKADVSVDEEVRSMVAETLARYGRIDILVNNAGMTKRVLYENLEELTVDNWNRVFAVNALGTFLCSRAVVPVMRKQDGGQIVNVSSVAGIRGQGSSIAYSASKAAVISITQAFAVSQAPQIRVNAVAPGVVETRWIEGMEEFSEPNKKATPLGRLATPEDVAQAIYSLAANEFITGQVLVVDGGRTLKL